MQIKFSPVFSDATLSLAVSGDVLTVNGVSFDFSALPEGSHLPRAAVGCDMLASDVRRVDGQIALSVILPHAFDAPEDVRFPAPITAEDGPVTAPGLVAPGEDATAGDIDWTALIADTAAAVPQEVSRFQARAALLMAGHLPAVEAAIAQADPLSQLAWADAQVFRRDSPTIAALAGLIGMNEAQIDALFIQAAQIQA